VSQESGVRAILEATSRVKLLFLIISFKHHEGSPYSEFWLLTPEFFPYGATAQISTARF
jgi:hypothetical protein